MNEEIESRTNDLLNAAKEGYPKKVCTSLEAGANVDATGVDGWTPLMIAAAAGHTITALLLVDAGADVDASAQGQTALMLAAEHGHFGIVDLLERAKANRELKKALARFQGTGLGGGTTRHHRS